MSCRVGISAEREGRREKEVGGRVGEEGERGRGEKGAEGVWRGKSGGGERVVEGKERWRGERGVEESKSSMYMNTHIFSH